MFGEFLSSQSTVYTIKQKFIVPGNAQAYYTDTINYFKNVGFQEVNIEGLHFPYIETTLIATKLDQDINFKSDIVGNFCPFEEPSQGVQNLLWGIKKGHGPYLIARKALQ